MKKLILFTLTISFLVACTRDTKKENKQEIKSQQPYDLQPKEAPLEGEIIRLNLPEPTCEEKTDNILQYLFLGHTYHWHSKGDRIDWRLEMMNLKCFDQIWLGGDVCSETTKQKSTVNYIDSIFDVGKPGNFWVLGNHDIRNGNLEWIKEKTGRNTYYTERLHDMTVVVFNSHFPQIYKEDSAAMCEEGKKQTDFLMEVLDTVSNKSSHLIFMTHHVLWSADSIDSQFWTYSNYFKKDWRFYCDTNATFENLIYPKLVEVQKNGTQVICLAGDCGTRDWGYNRKFRDHKTKDGIQILASGINNSRYPNKEQRKRIWRDKILIFSHDTLKRELNWEFHDFDSLVEKQMQTVQSGFQL